MGISFYTFQSISYTIDIYRNTYTAEKKFFFFLAYVTFWPQLVAGPILRADEIISQFYENHKLKFNDLIFGGKRILIGLFKKAVLADTIARSVDHIYSLNPNVLNASDVIIAAFLFGFQIYFDFAGYSDIAIGSARVLGFRIPENFNWPYLSKNPREFWKNWHISLSSWIRDYLYVPLLGKRNTSLRGSVGGLGMVMENEFINVTSKGKKIMALFLTWFIMGLWHGAGWNFAIWGLYHAFFIFIYRFIGNSTLENRFPVLAISVNFLICMISWIPFRASSPDYTMIMFSKLINPFSYNPLLHQVSFMDYLLAALLTVAMATAYMVNYRWSFLLKSSVIKVIGYSIIIFLVLVFLQANEQFIYFQF